MTLEMAESLAAYLVYALSDFGARVVRANNISAPGLMVMIEPGRRYIHFPDYCDEVLVVRRDMRGVGEYVHPADPDFISKVRRVLCGS